MPFSECRNNLAGCFSRVRETHRPLIVTQNGRASTVLISAEDFDPLMDVFLLSRTVRKYTARSSNRLASDDAQNIVFECANTTEELLLRLRKRESAIHTQCNQTQGTNEIRHLNHLIARNFDCLGEYDRNMLALFEKAVQKVCNRLLPAIIVYLNRLSTTRQAY